VPRQLESVDGMSWSEFDRHCRRIVLRMAQGIRRDAALAKVKTKTSYAGVAGADVVTTADTNAQARFVRLAGDWLPAGVGWRGEENGLSKPSTLPRRVVITVDPADGTRKLIAVTQSGRLPQRGEVSSMLAVLVDGEPVGSYICDVGDLTQYVLMPYSSQVLRLNEQGREVPMQQRSVPTALGRSVLLRHGRRDVANPLSRRLAGLFGEVQRDSQSIGLSVTSVLTGDFAATLRVAGGYTTPWDDAPISAMCRQGAVVSLRVGDGELRQIDVGPLDRLTERDFDMLYVGRQYLDELRHAVRVVML
jgi:fructose-1,6-bisphosphatase/inositol monophosphatase family enzyme